LIASWRTLQRLEALQDRGGPYWACCDLCGTRFRENGFHYHEIVTRGRTINNGTARELSFDKHICACLCEQCHTGSSSNAHNLETDAALLVKNAWRYGYDSVSNALQDVNAALIGELSIKMPEREKCLKPPKKRLS